MMNVFKEFLDELPQFKEYWVKFPKDKQMSVVNKLIGMKVAHFAKVLEELFDPVGQTNIECTHRMLGIVEVAMKRWKK